MHNAKLTNSEGNGGVNRTSRDNSAVKEAREKGFAMLAGTEVSCFKVCCGGTKSKGSADNGRAVIS